MRTIILLFLISLSAFFFQKKQEEIVIWIQSHCKSLSSNSSNDNGEDLLFLSKLTEGNRILSIGEEAHGIGNFAVIKFRIFKYLALNHNYKIFAIEEDFCKVEPLNHYIISGEGDPNILLRSFMRSYANQETKRMIEWMRLYNSTIKSEEDKLKIFGFDSQSSELILNSLKKIFINEASIYSLLDSIKFQEKRKFYGKTIDKSDLVKIKNAISNYQKQNQYSPYIHQLLKMLQYSQEISGGKSINRDYYMAQTCSWILKSGGNNSRMLISAQNGHIAYNKVYHVKRDTTYGRMGFYLKKEFKNQLYTVGIDFNKGSFWATSISSDNLAIKNIYTVPNAPEYSLSSVFSKTGEDILFLDFNDIQGNDIIRKWFSKPQSMRYVSASFNNKMSNQDAMAIKKPLDIFDGLIFYNEVTASELLSKKRR